MSSGRPAKLNQSHRKLPTQGSGRVILSMPTASHGITNGTEARPSSGPKSVDSTTDLARCFLRLANLPSYPLDRLSSGMKRSFGARPARSCLLSMPCIVANHKRDVAVSAIGSRQDLRPTDATTIELPDPPIYAIDAEPRPGRVSERNKSRLTKIGSVWSNRVVTALSAMHVPSRSLPLRCWGRQSTQEHAAALETAPLSSIEVAEAPHLSSDHLTAATGIR
jgi:hypothetical protein